LNRKHCVWQTVDTFGSTGLHVDVVRLDRRKTFSTRTFPSVVHRRRHLEVRRARVYPRKCEFETLWWEKTKPSGTLLDTIYNIKCKITFENFALKLCWNLSTCQYLDIERWNTWRTKFTKTDEESNLSVSIYRFKDLQLIYLSKEFQIIYLSKDLSSVVNGMVLLAESAALMTVLTFLTKLSWSSSKNSSSLSSNSSSKPFFNSRSGTKKNILEKR
jgi:hypothetical protein